MQTCIANVDARNYQAQREADDNSSIFALEAMKTVKRRFETIDKEKVSKKKKEEALEKENALKQMLLNRKDRPSKGNTSLHS